MSDKEPHLFEGVIAGAVDGRRYSFPICMPRNEVFRLKMIFEEHEYGPPEVLRSEPKPVIVDIGANVGLFTLYMKAHFPAAEIRCFEPDPASFALLKSNLASLAGIAIHEAALSDFEGTAPLNRHTANSGRNSLYMGGPDYSGTVEVRVKKASVALSDLDSRIDILKIDTEGAELPILGDLKSETLARVRCLMVEFHSEDDRRGIDALMKDFYLVTTKAHRPGVGLAVYLAKSVADSVRSGQT